MKYFYDPANPAFYCDDIHSVIPETSIEVSGEHYLALRAVINDSAFKIVVVEGEVTIQPVYDEAKSFVISATSICDNAVATCLVDFTVSGVSMSFWRALPVGQKKVLAKALGYSIELMDTAFAGLTTKALEKVILVRRAYSDYLVRFKVAKVDELPALIHNFEMEVTKLCSDT